MPANIKLALSLAVLAVGAGAHYWERQQGDEPLSWVIAALAVFMVLAMWLFPETGGNKGKKT